MTHYSEASREFDPSLCRISMTASSKLSGVRMPAAMAPTGPIHFDYENDWHLVVPHLSDPGLQQLLDTQLGNFIKRHFSWRTYEPGSPPWIWTDIGWHCWQASERAEQAGLMTELYREFGFICPDAFHDAIQNDEDLSQRVNTRKAEIKAPFLPQHDEVAFYQVYGACHFLAPFFAQLARRVVPDLVWTILSGRHHSTVIGRRTLRGPDGRKIVMLFDPLRSHQPASETLRDVKSK
jgi:hypothetical protein